VYKFDRKQTRDQCKSSFTPSIVHDVLREAGRPIDPAIRAPMESRLGHDFSRVRVHTDDRAARSAQAISALAYTSGNHIAFGANQYQPHTAPGRHLLMHELTHFVQQSAATAPVVQRQPTFPKTGIQVTGPDADELKQMLSTCTGMQLDLDKDNMLQDTGKKASSKTVSAVAKKQLQRLLKVANGIIIDTDRDVPGTMIGGYRSANPGFHNVNVQQIKVMAAASGASGGVEACSAILHEISEAANARTLSVQGKTASADIQSKSHEYGFDIENKIRADLKLPPRQKTGSMLSKLYKGSDYLVSIFSNVFGTDAETRTQLDVIKTSFNVSGSRPKVLGNEILASHVEMGTVSLGTADEGRDALKKFFPKLHTQFSGETP
jgi:hypothetical protein